MRYGRAAGRYLRIAIITLVVLGFLPLLMISAARLMGGSVNGAAQVAPLAPIAAACWLVALLLLLSLRAWWFAGFAGLLVAVHLFWLAPPVLERLAADPVPDGTALRVLTVNVEFGGADVAELAQLVKSRSVDLVAVEEMTADFEAKFTAAVGDQLPSHVGATSAEDLAGGTGIWSRWPLQSQGLLNSRFRMPKVQVSVPGIGPVEVIAVHTLSPIPTRVPGWRGDLEMLAAQAASGSGPTLMMGDFNATRDHAPFRKVLAGRLFDTSEAAVLSPWKGQTWPADRRFVPPAIRIDHILASKGDFSVSSISTFEINGTDHRAVEAVLLAGASPEPSGPVQSSAGTPADSAG